MRKIIMVDPTKCTGCRLCEMVCSVKSEGVSNPFNARIHIVKWEFECFEMAMICQQCDSPFCAASCPVGALSRDTKTNAIKVDYDRCIGCRMCILACPFGGIKYDVRRNKVAKCELCNGDPTCVKFCDTEAITYVDADKVDLIKQRNLLNRDYHLRKEYKESIPGTIVGHPGKPESVAPGWGRG